MDPSKQLQPFGAGSFDCHEMLQREERNRLASKGLLVLVALAALLACWSPLKSLFQRDDVYFAGIATLETPKQDRQRPGAEPSNQSLSEEPTRSTKFYLRFNRFAPSKAGISVSVDDETLTHWRLNEPIRTEKCSLPDMIFSDMVRGDRTRCRIVLTVVSRDPDGNPTELEFSELEWLPKFESTVAGLVDDSMLSQYLFPYAVLVGKATGFTPIPILAIPLVLQLAIYGHVVWSSRQDTLAPVKGKLILATHFLAAVICVYLSIFPEGVGATWEPLLRDWAGKLFEGLRELVS